MTVGDQPGTGDNAFVPLASSRMQIRPRGIRMLETSATTQAVRRRSRHFSTFSSMVIYYGLRANRPAARCSSGKHTDSPAAVGPAANGEAA